MIDFLKPPKILSETGALGVGGFETKVRCRIQREIP